MDKKRTSLGTSTFLESIVYLQNLQNNSNLQNVSGLQNTGIQNNDIQNSSIQQNLPNVTTLQNIQMSTPNFHSPLQPSTVMHRALFGSGA